MQVGTDGVEEIASTLHVLLDDVFAVFVKTQTFHWHMSGAQFSEWHRMLGEQADQLLGVTNLLAERLRTIDVYAPVAAGEIPTCLPLRVNGDSGRSVVAGYCPRPSAPRPSEFEHPKNYTSGNPLFARGSLSPPQPWKGGPPWHFPTHTAGSPRSIPPSSAATRHLPMPSARPARWTRRLPLW
jgi:hypothetical protein